MMKFGMVLALVLATALPAAAQERSFGKDDVARLLKAEVSEELILAKIDLERASFRLTVDDVVELKGLKATDKLLAKMLAGQEPAPAPRAEAPAPVPGGSKTLSLKNASHRAVKVSVDAKQGIVDFSLSRGADLPVGGSLELQVAPGEYAVAIEGRATIEKVKVGDAPALVTVRGADTEYLDVQTAVVEDAGGRRVVLLHSQGKLTPGQVPAPEERVGVVVYHARVLYGPRGSLLPILSDRVILGAGVGAIIGHQRGHLWRGAAIGAAAGWLMDRTVFGW